MRKMTQLFSVFVGLLILWGGISACHSGDNRAHLNQDLKARIEELKEMVRNNKWESICNKYNFSYLLSKERIIKKYSFDKEGQKSRLQELLNKCSEHYRLGKISLKRGDSTIHLVHVLLNEKESKSIILENTSTVERDAVEESKTKHNRLVIKVSYQQGNAPFYFNADTSFLSAGYYDSKQKIIKAHFTGNYRMNESDRGRLYSWIHEIKEATIIFDDYARIAQNGDYRFTDMPRIRIYSITCFDGFNLKESL